LCEGWREVKFTWVKGKSGSSCIEPIFIHFEFDDYRPDILMQDSQNPDTFFTWRMAPPGEHRYFFTINGEVKFAKDKPILKQKLDYVSIVIAISKF
jgi:hypothetical protein